MTSPSPMADAPKPLTLEWRCFYCDEVFTDAEAAADHFGREAACEPEAPACKLNQMEGGILRLYREALIENQRLMDEDSPSYREFYAIGADHATALRQEEEKGYARGLRDGRAEVTASRAARGVDAASLALARADITYRGGKFTYTDEELRGTFAYEEAKRRVEVVFSAAPAPAEADALRAALDKLWDELSDQHEVDDPDDRCSICQAIQGVKRALTASTAAAGDQS